tara:strand:- start:4518 stop:4847 length:330 start_codon:yes stop_codon:yes gene_type:complete
MARNAKANQRVDQVDIATQVNTAVNKLPWWGKVILGVGGAYLILSKAPIVELLQMFFFMFLLPLMFLGSCGLATDGLITGLREGWTATLKEAERMADQQTQTAAKKKAA